MEQPEQTEEETDKRTAKQRRTGRDESMKKKQKLKERICALVLALAMVLTWVLPDAGMTVQAAAGDAKKVTLKFKDALYVGRGKQKVTFKSKDSSNPAKFYINSATAHKEYKTQLITIDGRKGSLKANSFAAGKLEESNDRVINQLIVNNVLEEGPCQLQMGLTELKPGSVWNTMPAHTHSRRVEAYFYFNVPEGNAICHFMGEPQEERVVWMQNEQAIMSPEWSIHAAAGTSNYMFIWGMAGENLDYGDMDKIKYTEMR